jgi:hypothetical protein
MLLDGRSMKPDTLRHLADIYTRYPEMWSREQVPPDELDSAQERVGITFSESYREFVSRYGGGHAGSLAVAGLRKWELAGSDEWSVVRVTEARRAARYPGTERWIVFSDDGFGNPIGLDIGGRVWLSDHNSCECVCLEEDFEDWLRRWALAIEPHRKDYLDRARWPGGS